MEAGGLDPKDTEDRADLQPNGVRKLSSVVQGEQGRNTKSGDPGRDKSSSTGFHGAGGQQNVFTKLFSGLQFYQLWNYSI